MPSETQKEKIAILDCGAQYTKVIDRRVREMRVETEIFPLDVSPEQLQKDFVGIIISGGPGSVYDPDAPQCHPNLFQSELPILGICYGMQLINANFGGTVEAGKIKEYGETEIAVEPDTPLFSGLEPQQHVLMSHGDRVETLAPGFEIIGRSTTNGSSPIVAAMANMDKKVYGVQFHPEVDLSLHGRKMLRNFLYEVCGVSGQFQLENRLENTVQSIRDTVGDKNVFVLVSGGVDSSVTAALLVKALGPEKVYAVHIDTGFMRKNESDLVCEALKDIGLTNLKRIDASEDFANGTTDYDGTHVGPLCKTTNPEHKRRIIGDVFYQLICKAMEEATFDLSNAFIAQGTLRPDLIESGNRGISSSAHKIKTHHNDVPIIQEHREKGLIIEPNQDLHKDEVRQIGRMLGLPEALVSRQPFPGPGLAIRILCQDAPEANPTFDQDQRALQELTQSHGYNGLILPIRSVGVQGDGRTYNHAALLKPEDSNKPIDWPSLKNLAQLITNQIHGINRVALLVNNKPLPEALPTITPTFLSNKTVDKLREVDHIVTIAFKATGVFHQIDQLLAVLVPFSSENNTGHSIAIRAVVTSDYMTARPAAIGHEIPMNVLTKIGEKISNQDDIDLVMYDITSKPPATVEWE